MRDARRRRRVSLVEARGAGGAAGGVGIGGVGIGGVWMGVVRGEMGEESVEQCWRWRRVGDVPSRFMERGRWLGS